MAGSFKDTVCMPPSTSRVTSTEPSPITTFETKVPCPQPVSAASIWPVWLQMTGMHGIEHRADVIVGRDFRHAEQRLAVGGGGVARQRRAEGVPAPGRAH